MSYDASTKGIGGEFTYVKKADIDNKEANTGSIAPSLPGKESGGDDSTTKSAIADGTVTITDEDAQLATTGETADETIASLNRDTDNAHNGPLERPPSLEELLAKQAELTEASAAAGKAVATTVGDISKYMYENNDQDPRWGEGGIYKTILQGAGAALVAQLGNGEGLDAALGAIASQLASNKLSKVADTLSGGDPLASNLIQNVLSGLTGSLMGGESGADLAALMDRHNRQIHPDEILWLYENAQELMDEYNKARGPGFPEISSLEEFFAIIGKEALMQTDLAQAQELHNKGNLPVYDPALVGNFLDVAKDINGNKLFDVSDAEWADFFLGWDLIHEGSGIFDPKTELYDQFTKDIANAYEESFFPFLARINVAQAGLPPKDQRFTIISSSGTYVTFYDGYGNIVGGADTGIVFQSGGHPADFIGMGIASKGIQRLANTMGLSKISQVIARVNGGATAVGAIDNAAVWAQKTYGTKFSAEGSAIYSKIAGKSISTVQDLTNAIKNGLVSPADLPIDFIVREGQQIILNTRTTAALTKAGIPRHQWVGVNQTGKHFYESQLSGQLSRNGLTNTGVNRIRIGVNK